MCEQNEKVDSAQNIVYIIWKFLKIIYIYIYRQINLTLTSHQAVSVNNDDFVFQYIFVSLLSRDSTYKLLKSVCGHLEVSMTALSLSGWLHSVFLTVSLLICFFPFVKTVSFQSLQNASIGNSPNPSSLENSFRADRPSSLPLVSCLRNWLSTCKESEYGSRSVSLHMTRVSNHFYVWN